MKKISFVVTNTNFERLDEFQKDILQIIGEKYEYEFIFVSTTEDKEKQKDSENVKFVTCNCSLNKQIKNGFELTDDNADSIVLCDMSSGDYNEYVAQLIESWEQGAKIVRLKRAKNESNFFKKIGNFFKNVVHLFNNLICRLAGYKGKVFCYNSYQLFDKEVFKLIKTIPQKNAYFRNNEVLLNYETSEIITNSKLTFANNKHKWSKKMTISLVLFSSFIASIVAYILIYPLTIESKFSINFSAIMIFLGIGLFVFSIYFLFSSILDFQLDRE